VSASVVTLLRAVRDVPSLEPKAWRDALRARLGAGHRAVTLYARRKADAVQLTSVTLTPDRALDVSRTTVTAQFGYHELTTDFPALHCFEREMHEQTGVRIAGHPWLKPIRFEGKERAAMDRYPFYRVEGKEVHEVAVGPVHAGVIEPGAFRFMCHGEQVAHLEIHLGYQHRGVEALLRRGDPRRLSPWVETAAGDTSVAHTWAYCAAAEALTGCEVTAATDRARAAALELERVAMHLSSLSGMAADVGFLQGATTWGRLRTTAINLTMRLCGSRFGRGALRPGRVGLRCAPEGRERARADLDLLRRDGALIKALFLASQTVQHRLNEVGVLPESTARALGLVGVAARASGVPVDARAGAVDGAYAWHPVAPVVLAEGDCMARARVRIEEIEASLAWLAAAFAEETDWPPPRVPVGDVSHEHLSVALVEGCRGEVVHCIESDAEGAIAHYKVQDPSLRNWMGLAIAVRQNEISDFPICNKSFDLSYCGNDL
jgi:Ni,Fe-hydrogenase III large subunit